MNSLCSGNVRSEITIEMTNSLVHICSVYTIYKIRHTHMHTVAYTDTQTHRHTVLVQYQCPLESASDELVTFCYNFFVLVLLK